MEPAYKYCPTCGAEFQPWVSRCSDCDRDLDWAPQTPFGVGPVDSVPPARELACLQIEDQPSQARELALALQAGGVPCRVDSHPPEVPLDARQDASRGARAPQLGVYVREQDMEAARAIQFALLASRSPELAEVGEVEEPDENACPACAEALDPSAASCGSCGLAFPER